MATVLRLANASQTTTVDLLNGTLKLGEAFTTRTPANENNYSHTKFGAQSSWKHYGVKVESFALNGEDTVANLIAGMKAIEDLLEKARLWHEDPLQTESVWLEWNANGESAKRVLIYEGSIQILGDPPGASALLKYGVMRVRLNLSTAPLAEDIALNNNSSSAFTHWGSTGYSLPAGGTAPARIAQAYINLHTATNLPSGNYVNLWCGIRPTNKGLTSFTPVSEAEGGSLLTDASLVSISGASPSGSSTNNVVRVTFSTTTLVPRLNIAPAFNASSPQDYIGRYLVLLRCRLTASGQCGVQMKSGFIYDTSVYSLAPSTEVFLTNTNWKLLEIGTFQFPPASIRANIADSILMSAQIQILAERISGTPDLEMDAIYLVPADHLVAVKNFPKSLRLVLFTSEDEKVECAGITSFWPVGNMYTNVEFSAPNFHLPVAGGKLFAVLDSETEHLITTSCSVSIYKAKRYLSYRS